MIYTYRKRGLRLTAAALTAVMLLTSCVPPNKGPSDAQSTGESYGYERYRADELAEQKRFDQFTNRLFEDSVSESSLDMHFSLADPAAYGLAAPANTFGEYTLDYMKENISDARNEQKELESFQLKKLTADQKLTWQILQTYYETELTCDGLELYASPIAPTIGVQTQLPILLSEYSFYTRADVDAYLELISDLDRYFGQLLEFEKQKSAAGLFMSDEALDEVLESCQGYLIQADHSILTETFNTRIDALTDLTEEEKNSYKEKNMAVVRDHFVPAYELLSDGLANLNGTGKNDKGLYYYPQGKQYYEYLVKSRVCPSYDSVDKLTNAVLKQFNSDLSAMAKIAQEHPDIYDSLDTLAPSMTNPDDIIVHLQDQIQTDFPALPECNYTVKYVPEALQAALSPAFYLVPPLDRYQDNVIYINPRFSNDDLYHTLAHEGYPGHLYQSVYFISRNSNPIRHALSFSSYSEGWATYVEQCSYNFKQGEQDYIGRFLGYNSSTSLALYALLDIYINYEGWDRDQTKKYLFQFYNIDDDEIVSSIYNALVGNPTNYLEYYVGYMEIMEMRNTAEKVLGDSFDAKEFHSFLLDLGPAQFSVILPQFQIWLRQEKANINAEK